MKLQRFSCEDHQPQPPPPPPCNNYPSLLHSIPQSREAYQKSGDKYQWKLGLTMIPIMPRRELKLTASWVSEKCTNYMYLVKYNGIKICAWPWPSYTVLLIYHVSILFCVLSTLSWSWNPCLYELFTSMTGLQLCPWRKVLILKTTWWLHMAINPV